MYDGNKFLIASILGSDQENDLTVPPNCEGYGRIRHFRRVVAEEWTYDPLPIDPACRALGIEKCDMIETQVFQIASCNLNCWYCFVPDELKCAKNSVSKWFTSEELIALYLKETNRAKVIDLSGGNPELVPEWILNTMYALERANISDKVYLWSDDTLTTDYTFTYLSNEQLDYMKHYKNYGKVACFKGYNASSFEFNTGLPKEYFDQQLIRFEKYLDLGIDLYGYITLTTMCKSEEQIVEDVGKFMDRLQKVHMFLPLRIVPLKIVVFTPVKRRLTQGRIDALDNQMIVIKIWKEELKKRYSNELLRLNIADIKLL